MQNWDDLRFCLALDRFQTMTAAAKALRTNTATVSRRIERLTDQAGQPLFLRENSNWVATDLGRELAAIAERIEEKIQNAEFAQTAGDQLRQLHVCAPETILQAKIATSVKHLVAQYPELDLTLSSELASLAFGETDLVISHIEPTEGRIIRRKLGQMCYRVYGSEEFLNEWSGWIMIDGVQAAGVSQAALLEHFGAAARQHTSDLNLGAMLTQSLPYLSLLPMHYAETVPGLVRVDAFAPIFANIWLSYHYTRKSDPAIKLAVEWIETAFVPIRENATIN